MTVQTGDRNDNAINVEFIDSLAIVRLCQPGSRNSLSTKTLGELDKAVSALVPRQDISALVFTGTGDVFASGANIRELAALTAETAEAFADFGQSILNKIANARQTTIAAINGYCLGGGLDLALACDLRCASNTAVFAHPGARLGIITGWGGTQRLPRLIGAARAFELFATARRVTSSEAFEIGLVNRIADPVLDCAFELVR